MLLLFGSPVDNVDTQKPASQYGIRHTRNTT